MTTLFYPGTDPTVTRVGLAHYGESLAAHSFFRVHGPQKSRTADPHHLTRNNSFGVSLILLTLLCMVVLSSAPYRGYQSCWKQQRSSRSLLSSSVSFSSDSTCLVVYLFFLQCSPPVPVPSGVVFCWSLSGYDLC